MLYTTSTEIYTSTETKPTSTVIQPTRTVEQTKQHYDIHQFARVLLFPIWVKRLGRGAGTRVSLEQLRWTLKNPEERNIKIPWVWTKRNKIENSRNLYWSIYNLTYRCKLSMSSSACTVFKFNEQPTRFITEKFILFCELFSFRYLFNAFIYLPLICLKASWVLCPPNWVSLSRDYSSNNIRHHTFRIVCQSETKDGARKLADWDKMLSSKHSARKGRVVFRMSTKFGGQIHVLTNKETHKHYPVAHFNRFNRFQPL